MVASGVRRDRTKTSSAPLEVAYKNLQRPLTGGPEALVKAAAASRGNTSPVPLSCFFRLLSGPHEANYPIAL